MDPPYTSFQGGDCDDESPAVNPLVPEICNNKDDDCDGQSDPEGAQGCMDYFLDEDGDGFGVTKSEKCLCGPSAPYSATEVGDCGPDNPGIFPGSPEECDGEDNDCNGAVDDVDEDHCIKFYKDGDGDGFGNDDDFICGCDPKPEQGYEVVTGGDCDDEEEDVNPDAAEVCGDGIDNNCDGLKEENCVPSGIQISFISAALSDSSGNYKIHSQMGTPAASNTLQNNDGFTIEIGLIPTSVLGQ